jgi:hypothetical protein
MAYLRVAEARSTAFIAMRSRLNKNAYVYLRDEARNLRDDATFDVFLSHSYADADVILGVKKLIEGLGLTVYVDWIDDAGLDRDTVDRATAAVLRRRLDNSKSLIYANSPNASNSKWMPWELGYFDGRKPKFIWILPIVTDYDSEFIGQEYLGLYPTVEKLAGLPGLVSLGFKIGSGVERRDFPLREALTHGVYYPSS